MSDPDIREKTPQLAPKRRRPEPAFTNRRTAGVHPAAAALVESLDRETGQPRAVDVQRGKVLVDDHDHSTGPEHAPSLRERRSAQGPVKMFEDLDRDHRVKGAWPEGKPPRAGTYPIDPRRLGQHGRRQVDS